MTRPTRAQLREWRTDAEAVIKYQLDSASDHRLLALLDEVDALRALLLKAKRYAEADYVSVAEAEEFERTMAEIDAALKEDP